MIPPDVTPHAAILEHALPTNEASSKYEQEDDRPHRAHQYASAVASKAREGHEDTLQVGWALKKADPSRVMLQARRRMNIVNGWHGGCALVEADHLCSWECWCYLRLPNAK
eukprot:3920071-Prymnesium_polylepis.3